MQKFPGKAKMFLVGSTKDKVKYRVRVAAMLFRITGNT
jgi:hypothetical protein